MFEVTQSNSPVTTSVVIVVDFCDGSFVFTKLCNFLWSLFLGIEFWFSTIYSSSYGNSYREFVAEDESLAIFTLYELCHLIYKFLDIEIHFLEGYEYFLVFSDTSSFYFS